MHEKFQVQNFSDKSKKLIVTINTIVESYTKAGYDLTLRQLYYQLVSKDIIPNTIQSYKRIVSLVGNARLAGLIDWGVIKDRGRGLYGNQHYDTPADILYSAAATFQIDKWADQKNYVLLMVEKQALQGILNPVCSRLDIPFSANKGYSSLTLLYEVGKIIQEKAQTQFTSAEEFVHGKDIHVLYLGDHDPSGMDMTRDVTDRLVMFSRTHLVQHRLALNMEQIEEFQPPENPAKETDSRYQPYVDEFGESSWELDALSPETLVSIVEKKVAELRDETLWNAAKARENEYRSDLRMLAARYENDNRAAADVLNDAAEDSKKRRKKK